MSPWPCVLSSWSSTGSMTLGHAGDSWSDITRVVCHWTWVLGCYVLWLPLSSLCSTVYYEVSGLCLMFLGLRCSTPAWPRINIAKTMSQNFLSLGFFSPIIVIKKQLEFTYQQDLFLTGFEK